MNKSKKIAVIFAVIMIFVGVALAVSAFAMMGFDIKKLNTLVFETNTYTVEEEFRNISIDGAECSVVLSKSEDNTCKVVCQEEDKISHVVEVEESTLAITRQDNRKWYEHIGIYWGSMNIVIYLPETEYDALYVKTLSGDIEIPEEFSFESAEILSTSGNVDLAASVSGDFYVKSVSGEICVANTESKTVSIQSTSGDVIVENVKTEADMKVNAVSGNVALTNMACQRLTAETSSGDLDLKDVVMRETVHIESVSGEIELYKCDAENIWIKTSSGDVTGSLLTEKTFLVNTSSGDVNVPRTSFGGKCEVTTTSGDIVFEIES